MIKKVIKYVILLGFCTTLLAVDWQIDPNPIDSQTSPNKVEDTQIAIDGSTLHAVWTEFLSFCGYSMSPSHVVAMLNTVDD